VKSHILNERAGGEPVADEAGRFCARVIDVLRPIDRDIVKTRFDGSQTEPTDIKAIELSFG
jgi:hypothetical protein